MKVTLLLGEAATVHPDGTVSVLRAGINRIIGPKLPVPFIGALVVRIDVEPAESSNSHTVEVKVINADGQNIIPPLTGNFNVGHRGGTSNLVLQFQMAFPQYGTYEFSAIIDKQLYGSWRVEVAPPPLPKGENK